jgi:hypothetical protein
MFGMGALYLPAGAIGQRGATGCAIAGMNGKSAGPASRARGGERKAEPVK